MLSIEVRSSLTTGSNFIQQLENEITNYTQSISIDGGFDTATITMETNRIDAANWIQNGIGRHIVVRFGGVTCWEGFVNRIDAESGDFITVKGPMLDVVNKARVTYQIHTFGGLVPGGQAITDFASDTEAQQGFYILEGDISGGTLVSVSEAEAIRDLYLAEYSRPQLKTDISGSAAGAAVTIDCSGYHHLLTKYYYLKAVDADIGATQKIKDVIDADPNNIFSSSKGYFEDIGLTVNEYEDWSRTGADIVFELTSLGNSSNNRMSFGIYGEQEVTMASVSRTDYDYELSSGFNGSLITMKGGGPIPLPFVRPGNWLRAKNYPIIKSAEGNRANDADILIESVTYEVPDQLSINGGAFDTFSQRLARFNFGLT